MSSFSLQRHVKLLPTYQINAFELYPMYAEMFGIQRGNLYYSNSDIEHQAAAADHIEDFARPSKRLTVKGVVRRITDEEETYVRSLWFDRFLWDEDNEEEEEEEEEVEQSGERLREPGTAQDTRAHLKLVDRPTSATKELHQAPVGKIDTDPASSDTKKVGKNKIERRMQEVISNEIAESATAEASGTSTSDSTNGSDVRRRNRSAGSPRVWLRNGQAADMGSEIESSETDDEDHDRSENSEVEEDDTIMEWTVEVNGEVGTSFYKLEMMSLQLDSFSGVQVMHCERGKPSNLDYLLQD
jgi:hypothetical protein